MKKRLMIGSALVAILAITSLVAFNAGKQRGSEPTLAVSAVEEPAVDKAALTDPAAKGISGTEIQIESDLTRSIVLPDLEPEVLATTNEQPGGTNEGIKVHGQWTIDVNDSEGKLVSHSVFENELFGGGITLTEVLARQKTIGGWRIQLLNTGGTGPCAPSTVCEIRETPTSQIPSSESDWKFGDLSVTRPITGTNSGKLVLSGSATTAADTVIDRVVTMVERCDPATAPSSVVSSCTSFAYSFTAKDLIPAIDVLPNQTVNVTVAISFS